MGSIGEPSNLIPYLSSDSASSQVTGLLYTSPLEYDKNFNIITCAAEEWEVLEGGTFMRFRLKAGIKWQREVLTGGATDVATIHMTRGGVPSGTISIPCRYVHAPCEMVDLRDMDGAVKMLLNML